MAKRIDIKPLKSNADYEAALKTVESLMDAKPGTSDGDMLDILATLVEAYEAKHFPIEAPDPVDAIKAFMDMNALTQADLSDVLQSRSRASEVLHRKRALTLNQVWVLHKEWGMPAECLVQPYAVEQAAS